MLCYSFPYSEFPAFSSLLLKCWKTLYWLRLEFEFIFDLVLFLPFSNTVIAIGNYFQTRMTVQRTVYSGRWECYLLLIFFIWIPRCVSKKLWIVSESSWFDWDNYNKKFEAILSYIAWYKGNFPINIHRESFAQKLSSTLIKSKSTYC